MRDEIEIKVGSRWEQKSRTERVVVVTKVSDDGDGLFVAYRDECGPSGGGRGARFFLDEFFPLDPAFAVPPHYDFAIQPRHAIREWKLGFALGNVVKYVVRADRKGTPLEDLEKARDYLDDEIAERRKGAAK